MEHLQFVFGRQSVAGFHFDADDALVGQRPKTRSGALDQFIFGPTWTTADSGFTDIIWDFEDGVEVIDLRPSGLSEDDITISDDGFSAIVTSFAGRIEIFGMAGQIIAEAAVGADREQTVAAFGAFVEQLAGGGHVEHDRLLAATLARAANLLGLPVVVLDEPNANLDAEGEAAVTAALRALKARGAIAVVIAHRPSVLAAVDLVLVMKEGEIAAFGHKEQVLARMAENARQARARLPSRDGLKVVQSADGGES